MEREYFNNRLVCKLFSKRLGKKDIIAKMKRLQENLRLNNVSPKQRVVVFGELRDCGKKLCNLTRTPRIRRKTVCRTPWGDMK